MHEWWCTHPGRSETAPCLHHSFVQQHKAVCGEGERSSDCLRLEEEHEMYMRERQDLASDQAQSREMHDAWCARPENDDTDFCEGWREWKVGQELITARGGDAEDNSATGGGHPGAERLATAEAMHEWWCTHPGRSETAPCLHHSFVQQHKAVCGEGERSSDCLRLEEEHEMYMRERQDLASDQAQSREMHDAWCARPENDDTDFCEGWREWKAGQGRGDRDEL